MAAYLGSAAARGATDDRTWTNGHLLSPAYEGPVTDSPNRRLAGWLCGLGQWGQAPQLLGMTACVRKVANGTDKTRRAEAIVACDVVTRWALSGDRAHMGTWFLLVPQVPAWAVQLIAPDEWEPRFYESKLRAVPALLHAQGMTDESVRATIRAAVVPHALGVAG